MRLRDVPEKLEQWSDDEDSEGFTAVEVVTATKANKEVTVFVSSPCNEVITDKDSGDEENVQLPNLPRNQIIADTLCAGNICIDKSMVPYFCRHPSKQFICGKVIRWNTKAWLLLRRFATCFH